MISHVFPFKIHSPRCQASVATEEEKAAVLAAVASAAAAGALPPGTKQVELAVAPVDVGFYHEKCH